MKIKFSWKIRSKSSLSINRDLIKCELIFKCVYATCTCVTAHLIAENMIAFYLYTSSWCLMGVYTHVGNTLVTTTKDKEQSGV